jgi:hypothetical protein
MASSSSLPAVWQRFRARDAGTFPHSEYPLWWSAAAWLDSAVTFEQFRPLRQTGRAELTGPFTVARHSGWRSGLAFINARLTPAASRSTS